MDMARMRTLLLTCVLVGTGVHAQNIGINASGAAPDASAVLDLDVAAHPAADKKGLLIPRMALTATNVAAPVVAPATSLLVYNTATAGTAPNNVTPGFYSWNGTTWVRFGMDGEAWRVTGNAGTTAGTNFIGTTDAQDFVVKTGGSAATNERLRVLSTGPVVLNRATAAAGDVLSVYASGTGGLSALGDYAVNGYTDIGYGVYGDAGNTAGIGVVAVNRATTGTAYGLWSDAASRNGRAIVGIANTSAAAIPNASNAIGVQGQVNGTLAATGQAIGVVGITPTTMTTGDARGVHGETASRNGIGVFGYASSTSTVAGSAPLGVYGIANNTTGFGVRARNQNASGTGLLASGNNQGGTYLTAGSGGAFTGTTTGALAYANSAAAGTGLLGAGNNFPAMMTLVAGSGVAANGVTTGLYSYVTGVVSSGVVIQDNLGNQWDVGGWNLGYIKIAGPGTVGTIVRDTQGSKVSMYCPEAPEVLFQDHGIGHLVNGHAQVVLDPILTGNILVDAAHPLKVFIQPEGDCKGTYVTNKSATGFEVHELGGGTSNIPFAWSIVATRADETEQLPDGSVRHSTYRQRFGPPLPYKERQAVEGRTYQGASMEGLRPVPTVDALPGKPAQGE